MKYLYIIKVGETFTTTRHKHGDFHDWTLKFLPKNKLHAKTIDVHKGQKLPLLHSAAGVIITGSHAMVSEELSWSLKLERFIQKVSLTNIPLLGICFGHQLIAKSLGGKSDNNPQGIEIGMHKVHKLSSALRDPLFANMPKKIDAFETHYQSVLKLPAKAKVLAQNIHDRHQAVRYSNNIWGVQFHPEFDETIMKEYISNQKTSLVELGFDVTKVYKQVKPCPYSNKVLENFQKIVTG